MADQPTDSAGELAAQLSGNGVRARVQTFSGTALGDDTGTAAPVRTAQQTQGTPSVNQNTFAGTFSGAAFQLPGVGAGRDDAGRRTTNSTQQLINGSFNGPVLPQGNVLDQYASYTYQLSWYLLTPDQFSGLSKSTSRINTNNWQLLVQSGGAPTQTTNTTFSNFTKNTATGRSQYFPYDYYLDNLVLSNSLVGKGSHSAVNLLDIQFKVTEPNGITLVNNLYEAVANLYRVNNITDTTNYQVAQYVMGIRFFGYDDDGKLVQAGNSAGDSAAIVEKYYPFRLTGLTFRMASRAIEYTITGTPINYTVNLSSQRGTIPYAFALAGQTLDQLFNGNPGGTSDQVVAVDGRTETAQVPSSPRPASPPPTATSSLREVQFNTGDVDNTPSLGFGA